ncbi:hypothetical protein MKW94_030137 [Papaver nudicaule]|uniref:Uncharacterized protein n=1 Tax=Papaver nudicaule TaxID=74823 RepID=A0AA41VK33_PAPNU|nr:hypothetical protein [Papaver nudicaule]
MCRKTSDIIGYNWVSCRRMGLIFDIIISFLKPLSLFKILLSFGLRTTWLVAFTWLLLVKAAVKLNLEICSNIVIWTVAIASLPLRILNAVQRERLLESRLLEMQIELEDLTWDKKKLEERLGVAIQDRRVLESILTEIEDEHDKAISQIEHLVNELQDLKEENLKLNEIQGKNIWEIKGHGGSKNKVVEDDGSLKSSYNSSGVVVQEREENQKDKTKGFHKTGLKGDEFIINAFPSRMVSGMEGVMIDRRRDVAVSQSIFSAILSLLVGMIIWKAEDPCMPLVVALFSVVAMSLKSVVQFFSTVENKPASDAVALLSFNWFILGTLTYPTLPKVASLFAPLGLSLAVRTVSWLGFASSL